MTQLIKQHWFLSQFSTLSYLKC